MTFLHLSGIFFKSLIKGKLDFPNLYLTYCKEGIFSNKNNKIITFSEQMQSAKNAQMH